MANLLKLFPFNDLNNFELAEVIHCKQYSNNCDNTTIEHCKMFKTVINKKLQNIDYDYYTIEQLNNYDNKQMNKLSIYHVNIRSLNANYKKLVEFISCCNTSFDVIVLSEIWNTNIELYRYLFTDYSFFYKLPMKCRAGGVALYVKNSINPNICEEFDIKDDDFESLWVNISRGKQKFIIGGIYRHPNTALNHFKLQLMKQMEKININCPCILTGDVNIDFNKYDSNNAIKEYVDEVIGTNFVPINYLPTRITTKSATIIDHVYINGIVNDKFKIKAGLTATDISDHLGNFIYLIDEKKEEKVTERPYERIYSKKNIEAFKTEVKNCSWNEVLNSSETNEAFEKFNKIFCQKLNCCLPMTKISKKSIKNKRWVTAGCRKSIETKHKLYKKWIKTRNTKDEGVYKTYAKKLKTILRMAEKNYYSDLLNEKINSHKSVWSTLNGLCNTQSKSYSKNKRNIINQIKDENKLFNNEKDIADRLNKYFSNIGNNVASSIKDNGINFKTYLGKTEYKSFYCKPTSYSEINNIIDKLKNSKTKGPDDVTVHLIKLSKQFIIQPLTHIINLSMSKGVFPEGLKQTRVIPIHKGGSRMNMSNYRPISITSAFSKIIEKVMQIRLQSYFTSKSILYEYQFGFRTNHSTSLALFEVMEQIFYARDNGEYVLGVFLDIKKAFDTVNHNILLQKLHHYGVRGLCLDWFETYLDNRQICTNIGSSKSNKCNLNYGVPQGSILGPLLFLIYINDMHKCTNHKLRLFADDSNLFIFSKTIEELYKHANLAINNVKNWLNSNKLAINIDKTNYMIFKPNDKINSEILNKKLQLSIDGIEITRVNVVKYLGMKLDEMLTFTDHVQAIIRRLNSCIGVFYRHRCLLNSKCRKLLYFSMINSILTYGVEIYGAACKSVLNELVISVNRTLRVLQFKKIESPIKLLYSEYNALNVYDLFKLALLKIVFRCKNLMNIPDVVAELFKTNNVLHNYNTRNSSNLHIFGNKTSKVTSRINTACMLWNKLPSYLKTVNYKKFIAEIKKYLTEFVQ